MTIESSQQQQINESQVREIILCDAMQKRGMTTTEATNQLAERYKILIDRLEELGA
jgi:hypothetical protein